jgi:FkbM family methyltransferase
MGKNWKARALLFAEYYNQFGLLHATKLFIRVKINKGGSIRLPHLIHPLHIRPGTSDILAFNQVFLEDHYKIRLSFIPRIIIDGGANVGFFAVKMKHSYPEAKIICVEPDRENFQFLQKNVSGYPGIICEPCALWGSDTVITLSDKHHLGKWGMAGTEDPKNGNIGAVSIPTLMNKHNIRFVDVLKLDIETAEKQIFTSEYGAWLPRVGTIIIELHDWLEQGCSRPFFEAVNKTFKSYRYAVRGENTIIFNLDYDPKEN